MFWRSIMAPVVALLIATTFVCTASAQPRDRDFDRGPGPAAATIGNCWLHPRRRIWCRSRCHRRGPPRGTVREYRPAGARRGGQHHRTQRDLRQQRRAAHRHTPHARRGALAAAQSSGPRAWDQSIIILARSLGGPRNRAFIDVYGEERRGREPGSCWASSRSASASIATSSASAAAKAASARWRSRCATTTSRSSTSMCSSIAGRRRACACASSSAPVAARDRSSSPGAIARSIASRSPTARVRASAAAPRSPSSVCGTLRRRHPRRRRRRSWEELGCGKVGIKPDRDSIRVGRREGRFSAIKLRVRGSKIELLDLTVVYERGPPDDLEVRTKIRDGDETPPLDLRGERRAIDRVDLSIG